MEVAGGLYNWVVSGGLGAKGLNMGGPSRGLPEKHFGKAFGKTFGVSC